MNKLFPCSSSWLSTQVSVLFGGKRDSQLDLADMLFERCHQAACHWPKGLAEILEQLVWATDDNGSEIMRTVERWLQSDDLERVRVAVEVQDVFPFRHRAEMDAALTVVKARWPELAPQCEELSAARAASGPEGGAMPPDVAERVQRLQELMRQALA